MGIEFFDAILPNKGFYCSVGINNGVVRQNFVKSKADIISSSSKLVSTKSDAYYALATFNEPTKRTSENAMFLKSLWLDVDCGEGKPYKSQGEGLTAVKQFLKTTGLPKPTVVNSGRGCHIYWPFIDHITVEEWKPLAVGLKTLCEISGLKADHSVTADAARILRVPETYNYKDPNSPAEVSILLTGNASSVDSIRTKLPKALPEVITSRPNREGMDDNTRYLVEGDSQSSFPMIVRKSLRGKGCAQIAAMVKEQDGYYEPLWRGGLSIAIRCVDGNKMIHRMSIEDHRYDEQKTQLKADNTLGPYTCAYMRELSQSTEEDLCAECTLSITSPILLGREFARAPKAKPARPEVSSTLFPATEEKPAVNKTSEPCTMDDLPYPYFKGRSGGVYKEGKDEDGEKIEIQIYEHNLFVTRRIYDPVDGETVLMCHELPHDEVREFAAPLKIVQSAREFKDVLSAHGVAGSQKQMGNIMSYTTAFVKELQRKSKADKAKARYGWNEDCTEFLIGEHNYTPRGEEFSPPSSYTRGLSDYLTSKGNRDIWIEGVQNYADSDPEKAFAVALGFAAPLMTFTGLAGVNVNFISNASGTGKTLALAVQNSIWGHPIKLMLSEDDTSASRQHLMGIMHNLPMTVDEMTNSTPIVTSEFMYATSRGRGKNRMEGQKNALRVNSTEWSTILSTSSNASPKDKLSAIKSRAEGEMRRFMDVTMTKPFTDTAGRDLYNMIENNYGVAGLGYAQWMVKYQKDIPDMINAARDEIEKDVGYDGGERFWVGLGAVVTVAAKLAYDCMGLDLGTVKLKDWVCELIRKSRIELDMHVTDHVGVMGEFLNENIGATLVINNEELDDITHSVIVKPAYGQIVVRYEAENDLLFVSRKALRDYCASQQISMDDLLNSLTGIKYRGLKKKRMTSGTGIMSTPTDTVEFDTSEVDMDDYIAEKK